MKLGVTFPQNVIGGDPGLVREFAQTAEGLGYSHIVAYDHVVGVNPASYPDWAGPYTSADLFHDPFTLFSYMAGITERIEFSPQIVILPQRQAVLADRRSLLHVFLVVRDRRVGHVGHGDTCRLQFGPAGCRDMAYMERS